MGLGSDTRNEIDGFNVLMAVHGRIASCTTDITAREGGIGYWRRRRDS